MWRSLVRALFFLALAGVFCWMVFHLPSFQQCISNNSEYAQSQAEKKGEPNLVVSPYRAESIVSCAGTYIDKNNAAIAAVATALVALFTIILAGVGKRQIEDTRILQRAYVTVEAAGIYMLRNRSECVAHVEIINSGNLPATAVKWLIRMEKRGDKDWEPPSIPDPIEGNNVIPPKGKIRQGSKDRLPVGHGGVTADEAIYLYIWGVVTYADGFGRGRATTFCHRYNCVNFTNNPQWGFAAMGRIHARDNRYGNSAK